MDLTLLDELRALRKMRKLTPEEHKDYVRLRDYVRVKEWRAANPERQAKQQARTRARRKEKNPHYLRDRMRAWIALHPGYARTQKHRRRAWKLAAGGTHTRDDLVALFVRQEGRCANPFCGKDLTASNSTEQHLDHIRPLSKGGSNAIGNLQFLCAPCNRHKSDFDPETWLEREAARAATLLDLDVDEVRDVFKSDCQADEPALECEPA